MKYPVQLKSALLPGLIASALVLSGCGGGGSDDDGSGALSTSPSSRGVITGFGSTYITGIKYETDDSEFDVDDDDTASQDDLRVGHVCTVYGKINDDGVTGTADKISCDNELQGPISNKTSGADPSIGTMDIFDLTIDVNANTRFEDDLTFADFLDGDCAEVSGFPTESGITATFIEKEGDCEEIEITGEIADLTDSAFTIRGVTINYDGTTELEDDIELVKGLYVEVKGELDPADNTAILAEKIEAEEDGKGEDDDEVEIQGVVSNYDPATMTFNLGIIQVDASNNPELSPSSLALGSIPAPEVEVEGHWFDGVLIAEEIEQKGRKIKINATLSAVGTETVTFTFNDSDIVVRVNQQTELEDDINDGDLLIANLTKGDYVEMEAFSDGSGDINAVELERKELDEVRIQAPVEAFDKATQMVTLLGIAFDLTAASYEDDDDKPLSVDAFYAELEEGVFIKLKDTAIGGDGTIDKAELED